MHPAEASNHLMALSRVQGDENIWIGGLNALVRRDFLTARSITHVLSVIPPDELAGTAAAAVLADWPPDACSLLPVDDEPDRDLLRLLPGATTTIQRALHEDAARPGPRGVLVHCAVGRSRSVTVVAAYLLRTRPGEFSAAPLGEQRPTGSGREAVRLCLDLIRRTRPCAAPNSGFVSQLETWWEAGCPDTTEALTATPAYRRWTFQRTVDESVAAGRAPAGVLYGDEQDEQPSTGNGSATAKSELRCRVCRRVLATPAFEVPHPSPEREGVQTPCAHVFIEPLSWMRPVLGQGELEGRLACPNDRCRASVGRYSWRGFRCSCGEWVTPAFSLQRAKVDRVAGLDAAAPAARIRSPPDTIRRANL